MKIDSLDHLVLTVRDIEASCDFYARVLGMAVVTFGAGRKALAFGASSNPRPSTPRRARPICVFSLRCLYRKCSNTCTSAAWS
jgi:catechol 2,3-dioxygenase-like lactoylglutathione lyase family enzyme